MNDTAITWSRRLYERLRGWGGLILGLTIGAVAFGVSTAGAGPTDDLQDPAGPQGIKEECAEGCVSRRSASGPGTVSRSSSMCGLRRPRPRPLGWLLADRRPGRCVTNWNQRPDRGLPPMRSPTMLNVRTPSIVALAALVAMLGADIVLRTEDDLSPWKGAGFAMFSTVDSPGMRTVAVWADVAGVEERVTLVGRWDDASRELRALPTAARTAALASGVASTPFVRRADGNLATATTAAVAVLVPTAGASDPTTGAALPSVADEAVVEVRRVRVDVAKLSYDDGMVRATLLRSASTDVVGGG